MSASPWKHKITLDFSHFLFQGQSSQNPMVDLTYIYLCNQCLSLLGLLVWFVSSSFIAWLYMYLIKFVKDSHTWFFSLYYYAVFSLGHRIARMLQKKSVFPLSASAVAGFVPHIYIVFKIRNIIRFRIDYYEISTLISWAIYSKDKLCDKKRLNDHDNQSCGLVRINLDVVVSC